MFEIQCGKKQQDDAYVWADRNSVVQNGIHFFNRINGTILKNILRCCRDS